MEDKNPNKVDKKENFNHEEINKIINIYFIYTPNKYFEEKFQLSIFLFSNNSYEFNEKYKKYILRQNSQNYNKYIICFEINNINNYEYFEIKINDEEKQFSTDFYNLSLNKNLFLFNLNFSNEKTPNIEILKFDEIFDYFNNFLNSNFKKEILSEKYDDFLECLINSNYKEEISNYFIEILNTMILTKNFSKLGILLSFNLNNLKIKNNETNKNIISILDSEEIYKELKNNIEKNSELKNKKITILNNYYFILFSFYKENNMNNYNNLIKKSSSENFINKIIILKIIDLNYENFLTLIKIFYEIIID